MRGVFLIMLKFDINSFEEFNDTLDLQYCVVIGVQPKHCVIPNIEGYIVKCETNTGEYKYALVLRSDNTENEYGTPSVFANLALTGTITGDVKVRVFDLEQSSGLYNDLMAIGSEDNLTVKMFSVLNIDNNIG